MIRSFTIVENRTEDGKTEYQVSGDLPIDEAAKALVIVAFNANKPEKEEKKSDVVKGDPP